MVVPKHLYSFGGTESYNARTNRTSKLEKA